jgi:hypothetical protein
MKSPVIRTRPDEGLTMYKEPNIGRPYASRNRYDGFLPIPNSNAGEGHEQIFA